ncbi:MAG: NUDIX hydrolase [Spirochaetales bacterium]|nr:NUDIX hydrolase [Spirochaetales bacterium]
MIKKWKTLKRVSLGDYRIFKTDLVERESSITGKKGDFFLVNSPNWVTIVPEIVNEDGKKCFLLVKQYRHGSDSITLEFPAGMVDPNEDSFETAKRELLEETGYIGEIILAGSINPNPAFMTNKTSTYIGRNLKKISNQDLDEHEEIETVIMPVEEFHNLVGGTEVNSAITIQAYYFYLKSLSPDIFNFG